MSDAVAEALVARKDEILDRLMALLRLPSVSTDPAYAAGMKATREFLMARLIEGGVQDVRLLDGGGQPAITGVWNGAPGKPTLLIYGHYDVQPPDPLELWKSPPFEPTIRDGRIYARGASDVKGSTLIAVETVIEFIKAGGCPVNIRFFLEGEEEIGSPSLGAIIDRYPDALVGDAMISADGGRASTTLPTVSVGSRGLTALRFTVRTASKDMHSGRYGGSVRNANHELARLVASLHDEDGRIIVPGYMAAMAPITAREAEDAAALPVDEAEFYARRRRRPVWRHALQRARAHHPAAHHRGERHVGRLYRRRFQDRAAMRGPRETHHAAWPQHGPPARPGPGARPPAGQGGKGHHPDLRGIGQRHPRLHPA